VYLTINNTRALTIDGTESPCYEQWDGQSNPGNGYPKGYVGSNYYMNR